MDRSDVASPSMPPVLSFDDVDSTNSEAFRLAQRGERGPLWVVAKRQTAGRGRSGRSWASASGNLFASYLVELACEPMTALQLSLVAGVAAHDALSRLVEPRIAVQLRLKWPNDLMIGGAKLGGILVETSALGGRLVAVVGLGVNLTAAPTDLGRAVVALSDIGAAPTAVDVMRPLGISFETWRGVWQDGAGFAQVRSAWLARAGAVGEPLSINTGSAQLTGTFQGISDSGALILRDLSGISRQFSFGDVSLLTPESSAEKNKK
jgi:BirA family biotin operon repressor/biotin-[acetyl-CoA-carboxylase] ligase